MLIKPPPFGGASLLNLAQKLLETQGVRLKVAAEMREWIEHGEEHLDYETVGRWADELEGKR